MHIKVCKCSIALFTAETKKTFKAPPAGRGWICISFCSSHIQFFASNFEIIWSNLDYKLLVLHVYSIFVWIMIQMQWLPLILNGKSTDKALFCLYEGISFICVTKLICS